MSAVLISIRPKYVRSIMGGEKKFELRRRFPMKLTGGPTLLIYESAPVSAVVAHARISTIIERAPSTIWRTHRDVLGISKSEFDTYFLGVARGFAIELEAVTELESKIPLRELRFRFNLTAPQSFTYVDHETLEQLIGRNEKNSDRHEHSSSSRGQPNSARKLFHADPQSI